MNALLHLQGTNTNLYYSAEEHVTFDNGASIDVPVNVSFLSKTRVSVVIVIIEGPTRRRWA